MLFVAVVIITSGVSPKMHNFFLSTQRGSVYLKREVSHTNVDAIKVMHGRGRSGVRLESGICAIGQKWFLMLQIAAIGCLQQLCKQQ